VWPRHYTFLENRLKEKIILFVLIIQLIKLDLSFVLRIISLFVVGKEVVKISIKYESLFEKY